jgi:predicted GNAT family acetyltransferase
MSDEIRVRCACGWATTGATDDVVAATQEHGRRLHNMEADREAVLAMAVPTDERPAGDEATELVVADHPEADRYEARLGDRVAAFSVYRRIGDRVVFLHTETDPEFEGRGIGSRLVRGALDDVRARGLRVTAKCPFVSAWLRRHPEYADLTRTSSAG